ncbi:DEAD/DEAH box helicase [Corynebacterium epidermidicanis]|uniref:Type III restriction enzyme, res subunit n=1 Tax=Corynebacterium epidermidicanis TaxID=1050174 RepID=A0A0G3GP44_9CORY|nr:DEAD/DEAH box helicase family protein [Corynebacterium epidermidicanis]AKK03001.1 Type III restriction enzyme, res subunit [Corynebacterium epidermidicanis]
MELKKYQKRVIADLTDYLTQLNEQPTLTDAFAAHWESRQIMVGQNGVAGYQNVIDGVPHVCYKVPTGGGKTFLACASVKPIFQALPPTRKQAVVWLVPSDSILTQTLAALKNPEHPYRQKLNADFGGRVEVYSKEELLAGQNFSPATVSEQLSVMVLSYDSFRTRSKDGRKAYQANGNLASFATAFGAPEQPIENADETALFQVINQLNPVVIVDESHHATSTLSHEMLVNFNPAFILDLTATPKKQANVISYVDALALKSENMVKLPVIAYNRSSQTEVITDAIDLRNSLEVAAQQQQEKGGRYIRPIVLFQAQPKTGEDATSFEKLREKLVKTGIPEDQIAIKTADINELKGVDLMSEDCPIRFIITVNALKEGWDCPFAYILASLANKTSQVDVEQILGRVLRQPHATKQRNSLLNMSYVLTSSNDFNATLNQIIAGLNSAGFSKRDFRAADQEQLDFTQNQQPTAPTELPATEPQTVTETEDFLEFDETQVAENLENCQHTETVDEAPVSAGLAAMLEQAQEQGSSYEQEAEDATSMGDIFVPTDLENAVETYRVNIEFDGDIKSLRLPQFVIKAPASTLFSTGEGDFDLLRHEALAADFVLLNKDIELDLTAADEQMYRVDVNSNSDVPKAFRMSAADQRFMREHFAKLSIESQKRNAADAIYERLKPINAINDSDLRKYIGRVVDAFGSEELLTYQEHPNAVAEKIKQKILGLLEEHKFKKFYADIETRRVDIQDFYSLPPVIQPVQSSSLIGGSLYEAEDRMNNDEMDFAGRFSGLENIRWWHRNIDRKGFCINGPLNHYPDFILMTQSGTVVIVEPKGAHLKNDDSRRKLTLGRKWADMAGNKFRYFMVFQDGVTPLEDAYTMSEFLRILEQL